ncbi:hypothetical protein [Actinosynnema sp. ALI-1.44]|nr:hypothetical protein [Actinosynnema sp. ALI-1.44]
MYIEDLDLRLDEEHARVRQRRLGAHRAVVGHSSSVCNWRKASVALG